MRTWQYYGLWQLEQGNRAQAQVHLDRIATLCGTSCAEYRSLSEAMGTVAAGGRLDLLIAQQTWRTQGQPLRTGQSGHSEASPKSSRLDPFLRDSPAADG